MDQAKCFVCLAETQEETEVVYLNSIHDEENNLTYGDCLEFCANVAGFRQVLASNENSAVCNDCSIELEISYKFLRKLMVSQNIISQECELNNSFDEEKEEETEPNYGNDNDEETQEICITEYVGEIGDWNADDLNEQQDSNASGQDVINFFVNETEVEEQDKGTSDEEDVKLGVAESDDVAGSSKDDLIEEIPYEEIEVHTNSSDIEEQAPLESMQKQPRRRVGKFNCDDCGKLFPNYSRMTAHRRCHEKTRTTFNCVECGRMYATDQALSVHVRTSHNKEGFTCPICSKVFLIERSLEIHMRYHTRDFPYDCKDCGKNFAQKGHLNTHQNVKHNGLRFICLFPNCNKLFTSSASLRDHEFSHNLKPFECQYCHGGYSSKSKLKTHIRQVHNIELSLEELEPMRRFHVMRSKPNVIVGVEEND